MSLGLVPSLYSYRSLSLLGKIIIPPPDSYRSRPVLVAITELGFLVTLPPATLFFSLYFTSFLLLPIVKSCRSLGLILLSHNRVSEPLSSTNATGIAVPISEINLINRFELVLEPLKSGFSYPSLRSLTPKRSLDQKNENNNIWE